MKITVKLFATLRENREKIMTMDVKEGTTPLEISQLIEIPHEDIAIIMINGRSCELNTPLKEEDVLALFPPVGGG
ncbi:MULTISPECIES: MoaD/ThiS family protein [unclassified Fusibacter]|uniref:MoaD/ThiS family protein n=1 Tax=unclassified Fusibacter TaxID=2624464 RepID=UPI001010D41D|nr:MULTISPECIES: MoaD/ThiS family protein [unclassified Fusibacter]MCK8061123.1 MoaD/ThiS family protein [Fusibacter sp. A2]NPE23341.1 MoaD/ThiS family protein [Fusibacter sp. A1]RXV59384.1 MoaD/ThiS family protein [Fusibacter sp. A1]